MVLLLTVMLVGGHAGNSYVWYISVCDCTGCLGYSKYISEAGVSGGGGADDGDNGSERIGFVRGWKGHVISVFVLRVGASVW